eukprot:1078367-Ditylum_brightwellii.AAC.1
MLVPSTEKGDCQDSICSKTNENTTTVGNTSQGSNYVTMHQGIVCMSKDNELVAQGPLVQRDLPRQDITACKIQSWQCGASLAIMRSHQQEQC